MLRRNLLKFPAVAAVASGLARPMQAFAAQSWQVAFEAASRRKPWLAAFRSVEQPALDATASIEGKIPAGLQGVLFRNGPARHDIGDFRYRHWFDGDGMMQAFRITSDGIRHQARMIETYKYQAERSAGRALYPSFASVPPDPHPVSSPDAANTGNISVMAHGGRLLALWEAGSPWEIDSRTLETRGRHVFSPDTAGAPFSAHPRVEADGNVWNFGYASGAGLLVLWHIGPDGKLKRSATVPCEPMGMPHDFIVTSRHLVLLIPPLHYEPDADSATFLESHRWNPQLPTRILLVDKADFTRYRWMELPAQWVFHFGNGWEDKNGIVHFDGARNDDPAEMLQTFSAVMRGEYHATSGSRHHHYQIDTRRDTVSEAPMFEASLESEFPVIDPRVSCRRNQRLIMLTRRTDQSSDHPLLDTVSVFDQDRDQMQHYRYPAGLIPEEHLFVPAPGSAPESSGWVLGSALNYAENRTELRVFDVEAVDAGPVATAKLPYALPLGLHGKFVAT